MLIVLSPAKTLDYESKHRIRKFTKPGFLDHSQALIDVLRRQSSSKLQTLMNISPALAELNQKRYQLWQPKCDQIDAKQAVLAFKGDVYTGLEAENMNSSDLAWAQNHLRILSGLYGVLRPLDLMRPYRLEMGTRLKTRRGKNLYDFWDTCITDALNEQLTTIGSKTLVNLASNEYFKSVKPKSLRADIISPAFRDWNNGEYRMIGFLAKKARGRMAAWIIKNRIKRPEKLVDFDLDGYYYDGDLSLKHKPVFLRRS
ncbi:MAG: peroxide stress protein YaaA [Arenicellales bacterium]